MPKVIRIEIKTGDRSGELYSSLDELGYAEISNLHNYNNEYPGGRSDFGYDILADDNIRFCTTNFCQFIHWFGSRFEDLNNDFNIFIYDVKEIIIGKSRLQAIFNINDVISKEKLVKV